MKDMSNMPGFTAEASLYGASEHYRMMTREGRPQPGLIHPADNEHCLPCTCTWSCSGPSRLTCSLRCHRFCFEPGGFVYFRPCSMFEQGR